MSSEQDPKPTGAAVFDHTSDPNFSSAYLVSSESEATLQRFQIVMDKSLALLAHSGYRTEALEVLDVGCGAATQARMWARRGHRVRALDVNKPLLDAGRERAEKEGLKIQFDLGSATDLPYPDASVDACLMPELLEHVEDWQGCLREGARVLRPGGLLYLSTTNTWNPVQEEFNLPAYSWYPGPLKRHFEQLARTTRPDLANHARYPAVNWFTPGGLARHLKPLGLRSYDRFDMMRLLAPEAGRRRVAGVVASVAPLRWLGFMVAHGTVLFALKEGASQPRR